MSQPLFTASVLLMLVAPLAAIAADDPPLPAGATALHLSDRAERVLPRDELVAVLRVEATGKTPRDVQAEVNRRMAAALDEAKKSAAGQIDTPSMSVYANRDPKTGTVWIASESLQVKSKDFAPTLALIGKLEDQGLAVSSVTFAISRESLATVQDALTAEALQRIRARAEAVAADLGLVVDHIRSAVVGEATPPWPRPQALMGRAEGAAAPPAVEPGEAPVTVAVNAEIVLLAKH